MAKTRPSLASVKLYLKLRKIIAHGDGYSYKYKSEKAASPVVHTREYGNGLDVPQEELWRRVRDARVFHIDVSLWEALYDKGQVWWKDTTGTDLMVEDHQDHHLETDDPRLIALAERAAFDSSKLPFDYIFITWGAAIHIAPARWPFYHVPEASEEIGAPVLRVYRMGFLLSYTGDIYEIACAEFGHSEKDFTCNLMLYSAHTPDRLWVRPDYAFPLVGSLDAINSHGQKVVRDFTMSYELKKYAASQGFSMAPPKEYYEVTLRDDLFEDAVSKYPIQPKNWHHRWDVRGHTRTLIQVRKKPLLPETKVKWLNKGWSVSETELPAAAQEFFKKKKLFVDWTNSWVATKQVWVDPHIKGPADKPYVPAVRTF